MMLVKGFSPKGVLSVKECVVIFHREQSNWCSREMIYWTARGEGIEGMYINVDLCRRVGLTKGKCLPETRH